jgi:hypothetical protein
MGTAIRERLAASRDGSQYLLRWDLVFAWGFSLLEAQEPLQQPKEERLLWKWMLFEADWEGDLIHPKFPKSSYVCGKTLTDASIENEKESCGGNELSP